MNAEETSLVPVLPKMLRPEPGSQITSLITGNTYTFQSKLGEGFFSEVYACTDVWNNELAVKILKPRLPVERMREAAAREFTMLLTVRNPYVTHTFDAFEFQSNFFIVTERCLSTVDSLFDLQNFNGMLWFMPIARCLLQAVHSLRVMRIAHQDIHLGNVMNFTQKDEMLTDRQAIWRFKLCDLGVARLLTDLAATELRKRSITPPEVLNPIIYGPLDHRIDIYHTGLVLLQLARSERLEFTQDEILAGKPRQLALELAPPYSLAIEKALRRRAQFRTATALELWRDIHSPVGT
jgi:serine/threonine protein kinase